MSTIESTFDAVIRGRSDHAIGFTDLRHLLKSLGFDERIKGSHHIFSKAGLEDIVNIQPNGHHAKAYQVRQIRALILKQGYEIQK